MCKILPGIFTGQKPKLRKKPDDQGAQCLLKTGKQDWYEEVPDVFKKLSNSGIDVFSGFKANRRSVKHSFMVSYRLLSSVPIAHFFIISLFIKFLLCFRDCDRH